MTLSPARGPPASPLYHKLGVEETGANLSAYFNRLRELATLLREATLRSEAHVHHQSIPIVRQRAGAKA